MAAIILGLGVVAYLQQRSIREKAATIAELGSKVAATQGERDAMHRELAGIAATIDEVAGKLQDVRRQQIAINELVSRPAGEMATQKDQMLADIAVIEGQLQRDRQEIDELSERIRQSGVKIAALENVVATLRQEIAQNSQTIAELRAVIENKDQTIRQVTSRLADTESSLETVRGELAGTRSQLRETEETLTAARNTAYVAIGTRDELQKQGVIEVRGLLRKSVTLADHIDEQQFTRVDITRDREFALTCRGKDVVLIPDRSPASYAITDAGKNQCVLRVTEPTQFWRIRYLAVLVKD